MTIAQAYFFICLFVLLMTSFLCSLYILEMSLLSDVGLVKIFFPFCRLPFCLGNCVLCFTEAFQFQEVPFINCFSQCATGVILRKWFPVPMRSSVLPTFSSMRLSVIDFMLWFLIHLDLSFVYGDRYGSIFILLHVNVQLCQHHLLNILSFFHFIFFASLSKIRRL